MFNHAIAGHAPPARISTDHAPLFRFHRWLANLPILEVEEIKSVPHVPISHPFVVRTYYNRVRVHRSLDGRTPANRAGSPSSPKASLAHYVWERHCNGLFESPVAARLVIRLPHGLRA